MVEEGGTLFGGWGNGDRMEGCKIVGSIRMNESEFRLGRLT